MAASGREQHGRTFRHLDLAWVGATGAVLWALCALVARHGTVGAAERHVFRSVNDLPQWLYRPMWLFQQMGNLAVAALVVLVLAAVLRRPKLALAVPVTVVLKLLAERAVKKVVERQRPGTSIGHITRRGDVSLHGLSFVSGHAVITTAFAVVLTTVLPRRWRPVPWVVVVLNGLARIYVGAHNPLDIVGGIGVGLVIGAVVALAFVAPARTSGSDEPAGRPAPVASHT